MTRLATPVLGPLLLVAALFACSDAPGLLEPGGPAPAKGGVKGTGSGGGGGDPTVSEVDPSFARQGETRDVTVYGSGFDETSEVSWELDGAVAATIHTEATAYVGAGELLATIRIDADAEIALYDVAVTSQGGRKKGVGVEKFEVTQAIPLDTAGGSNLAHGVTEDGGAAGFRGGAAGEHAIYWPDPETAVDLGPGHAWDLDEAATVVVGFTDRPVYWTGSGLAWTGPHPLPRDAGSVAGRAFAVASDPATGAGFLIGGSQSFHVKGKEERHEPMLWRKVGGAWVGERLPQPVNEPSVSSWANDVNGLGQAVGAFDVRRESRRPVFWDSDGTPQVLSDLAGTAQGIREDGSMIVGDSENRAAVWVRDPAGGWNLQILPGDCMRAYAIDAGGRIVATGCGANFPRRYSVLLTPAGDGEYTSRLLGGLGNSDQTGRVEALSRHGTWVGGSAPTLSESFAAVWFTGTPVLY